MKHIIRTLFTLLALITFTTLSAQEQFGISFDGAEGHLTVCDDDGFDIGEGFTVEAWIFSPSWRAEVWQGSVVAKDGPGPDSGFALRAGRGGQLNFVMSVNESWFEITTEPLMNVNQWYHVAATVASGTLSLFVNGERQVSGTFDGTTTANDRPINIGASPGWDGRIWNGSIDEVRIWDYARSAEELAANQVTDFTGEEEGLVLYLPFREGDGTTTANLADDDCPATFTGLEASAWGGGYAIPATDVGVSAVTAPDAVAIFSRPVKTRVVLSNYGSEAVSDIPIELSVNGSPTLTATFPGTLAPGASAAYVFEQPLDLTGNEANRLTATTALGTDSNTLNDGAEQSYSRPDTLNGNTVLTLLDRVQHNFGSAGQARNATVNLPENLYDYEQLRLHLSVDCPATGCDPWDQTGNLSIVTQEGEIEIARFITPYRIACGGDEWIVDVTDFRDILSGPVNLKSYIQVFGPSGWLLTAKLEMVRGDAPEYVKTTPLWATQYHVYGDPNIDDDLMPLTATLDDNTTESHFRLTMTGHGQGNTDNAAEFSNRTHQLLIDGEVEADHNLWKDDCAQNQCSGQLGTWTFNRAGWCPGQAVQPWILDLGNEFVGQEITLDYELQEYTNLLNSDFNNTGHTVPFYRIVAHLVEESTTAYEDFTNLRADSVVVLLSDVADQPTVELLQLFIRNTGTEAVTGGAMAIYYEGEFVGEEDFSETIEPGATLMLTTSMSLLALNDFDGDGIIARVTAAGDAIVSDDATGTVIIQGLVSTHDVREAGVQLYPNPSNGALTLDLTPAFLNGRVEVFDATGRTLRALPITGVRERLVLERPGIHLLRFTTVGGATYYAKVINQ